MKNKNKNRLSIPEQAYMMKYGSLPSDHEELLKYAKEHYKFTSKSFDKAMSKLEGLEWKTVEFILYLIPTPSPRPRLGGGHFYVKGAAQNKRLIKKFIERNILYTRCEISLDAYLPTPTSVMNNAEIYLAESKQIFPVGSCDVDNLMKTYLDMITGHLLLDDNIVTLGSLEKFYSLKPRLVVQIRYQTGFDSRYNEKRITKSKHYIDEYNPD